MSEQPHIVDIRGLCEGAPGALERALRRTRDNARGDDDDELTGNRPDWTEVVDYGAEIQISDFRIT